MKRSNLDLHIGAIKRMGLLDKLESLSMEHHVPFEAVLSEGRAKQTMKARLACYQYLRSLDMSFPEIGRVMLRDHTTVLVALKRDRAKRGETGKGDGGEGQAGSAT